MRTQSERKSTQIDDSQARLRRQLDQWMHPPAILDRGYLVFGYAIFVLILGVPLIIWGSPSLDVEGTASTTELIVGWSIVVSCSICMAAAVRDIWFRIECLGCIAAASLMATYCYGSVLLLIKQGPELRATFTGIVFIVTALLWARGLTLLRRWMYEKYSPKVGS